MGLLRNVDLIQKRCFKHSWGASTEDLQREYGLSMDEIEQALIILNERCEVEQYVYKAPHRRIIIRDRKVKRYDQNV